MPIFPHVLIIEADPAVRRMLAVALEREPLSVDTAADRTEAVEKISRASYAVVLLDLMLPELSGFELLETMRELKLAAPPIVIATSAYDDGILRRLEPSVVHACIRKPFDIPLLTALVRDCAELMAERRGGDAGSERTASAAPLH